MSSFKILSLPLLANKKIIAMLDFPDLLRFANCSSKTADLVRLTNIILLKLKVLLKQKCVIIDFKDPNDQKRAFNLVVNEDDYTGEDGFEWNGLGGLKFFESPVVGEELDDPEGPSEDDLSEPSDDSNSEVSDEASGMGSDADGSDEEADEESDADDSDENPVENSDADSDPDSDEHGVEVEEDYIDDSGDDSEDSDEELDEEIEADIGPAPVPDLNWYCKVSSPANQNVFEVADLLITYLFDSFGSSELDHLALWPTEASKQLVEKHEQLQRCNSLAIADFWTSEISRPLTKELMEWSIDAVEAKDKCFYACNVIGEFKWERGFKSKDVTVEYGHWVHLNAILDSESETLTLEHFLPSSTFTNSVLKTWISNEKMKDMREIRWEAFEVDNLSEAFYKRVMNEIPEAKMTEEERERIMPMLRDVRWGEDDGEFTKFIRRTDGKLAAVFVETRDHLFRFAAF